jgi:hypothetical protein
MPASNNTAARRYLDLLRHVLCRDRFPDARYDMSSGSLQVRTAFLPPVRGRNSIECAKVPRLVVLRLR